MFCVRIWRLEKLDQFFGLDLSYDYLIYSLLLLWDAVEQICMTCTRRLDSITFVSAHFLL